MIPIIAQERAEAVRNYAGQISMIHADELQYSYERGRREGREEGHISEGRWWLFGVMCGIGLSAIIWGIWS